MRVCVCEQMYESTNFVSQDSHIDRNRKQSYVFCKYLKIFTVFVCVLLLGILFCCSCFFWFVIGEKALSGFASVGEYVRMLWEWNSNKKRALKSCMRANELDDYDGLAYGLWTAAKAMTQTAA